MSVPQAIRANLAQLQPLPTLAPPCNKQQPSDTTLPTTTTTLPVVLVDAPLVASHFASTTYTTYLFDCDGVLYRVPDPIPHAADAVAELISAGKRVFFVTNSSGLSRESMRDMLAKSLGLPELSVDQMVVRVWRGAIAGHLSDI